MSTTNTDYKKISGVTIKYPNGSTEPAQFVLPIDQIDGLQYALDHITMSQVLGLNNAITNMSNNFGNLSNDFNLLQQEVKTEVIEIKADTEELNIKIQEMEDDFEDKIENASINWTIVTE